MLKVKDSHKTLGKGESYDNYYDNTTWQHLFIVIISTAFITAIGVLLWYRCLRKKTNFSVNFKTRLKINFCLY